MGQLVEGKWQEKWVTPESSDGRFLRPSSAFRNWVTADGSAGPTGKAGFKAETGRYHLYVSLACPWAHRTLVCRKLKGLEDKISLSVVDPLMLDEGWTMRDAGADGATIADFVNHKTRLYEVYQLADPSYTGRVTVPVLWDKETSTMVSNESADIIRMLNSSFNRLDGVNAELDFYPEELREEIDALNVSIYDKVNNGVYKSGFAMTQQAYEEAVTALFEELDRLEERLSRQRYLTGDRLTEADWRLFPTLVRFDPVYVGHFKCNIRRIADYPNLSNYLRDLFQVPGVRETVNLDHIKRHYYGSHRHLNPTGIVPLGPVLDLDAPHDRDRFGG